MSFLTVCEVVHLHQLLAKIYFFQLHVLGIVGVTRGLI